jgi:hypothetical protein
MRRTTTDGTTIQGTGRWIAIQCAPGITARHSLWDYGDDNGDGTRALWFFNHYGHRFALGQFLRFGGPWGPAAVPMWEEADGLHHMAGIEMDRWDAPLMIELSEGGDAVRVWQEV